MRWRIQWWMRVTKALLIMRTPSCTYDAKQAAWRELCRLCANDDN